MYYVQIKSDFSLDVKNDDEQKLLQYAFTQQTLLSSTFLWNWTGWFQKDKINNSGKSKINCLASFPHFGSLVMGLIRKVRPASVEILQYFFFFQSSFAK